LAQIGHVYNGLSQSENVVVFSSIYTYISGWLDGARIGGCSHIPVIAGEHRGL